MRRVVMGMGTHKGRPYGLAACVALVLLAGCATTHGQPENVKEITDAIEKTIGEGEGSGKITHEHTLSTPWGTSRHTTSVEWEHDDR